ncbi:hypothetical protein CFC21_063169 [Triticum aestivum]|uniref:Uncharacterized protein n=4 Tax=Triticinae TaxID=1648030 RepID=A0A453J1D2_AEGTS|nr:uncharacterized protein LOC109742537 [Aegilops tauschii subsp. strangulata]XP_044376814.1 uncharacterized protein LOC123098804 [Triticum aestivum]KAF7055666.1 hypothetical protein CFC21_063169 [Triticum aestivum]
MENKEAPAAAAAAVPEKESTSCFKSTVGEDASLLEKAKDQYKQFTGALAGEHWECLKNKVTSMFPDPIPFFGGGAKDHGSTNNNTPPPVESH